MDVDNSSSPDLHTWDHWDDPMVGVDATAVAATLATIVNGTAYQQLEALEAFMIHENAKIKFAVSSLRSNADDRARAELSAVDNEMQHYLRDASAQWESTNECARWFRNRGAPLDEQNAVIAQMNQDFESTMARYTGRIAAIHAEHASIYSFIDSQVTKLINSYGAAAAAE